MSSSIAFNFGRNVFKRSHDHNFCGSPGSVYLDNTSSGGIHFTMNTALASDQSEAGRFQELHHGDGTPSAEASDWIGKHTESMQSVAVAEVCARQVQALREGGPEHPFESVGDLELQVWKLEATEDSFGSIWPYDIYIRDNNTIAPESNGEGTAAASDLGSAGSVSKPATHVGSAGCGDEPEPTPAAPELEVLPSERLA